MPDHGEAVFGRGWRLISPIPVKTFQSSYNRIFRFSDFPVSGRRISASASLVNEQNDAQSRLTGL
jgi:hypothetical protein